MYSEKILRTLPCYHCVYFAGGRNMKYEQFTERKCKLTNRWGNMNRANYCTKFIHQQIESSDTTYYGYRVRKDQIEDYRTEKQWFDAGYSIKPGEIGTEMYATRFSARENGKRFIYFLPEQVEEQK